MNGKIKIIMDKDKAEIENFNKYAHEWWNKRGPYKLLHNLTPVRLDYIKNQITVKDCKFLDIGCGGGLLAEALAHEGAIVDGVDASTDTIQIAKSHAKEKDLLINYHDKYFSDYVKSTDLIFDHIVCFEMIEHVDDQEELIKNIKKITKTGSKIFLSTINRNFKSFIFAKFLAEYVFQLVPRNTHTYMKFLKPSELNEILKKHGFVTTDVTGVELNPFNQKFNLSGSTDINYFLTAEKK